MTLTNAHVTALIDALDYSMSEAANFAHAARHAIHAGNQNEAIGTLAPLENQLEAILAMHRAALALHRHQRDFGGQP